MRLGAHSLPLPFAGTLCSYWLTSTTAREGQRFLATSIIALERVHEELTVPQTDTVPSPFNIQGEKYNQTGCLNLRSSQVMKEMLSGVFQTITNNQYVLQPTSSISCPIMAQVERDNHSSSNKAFFLGGRGGQLIFLKMTRSNFLCHQVFIYN